MDDASQVVVGRVGPEAINEINTLATQYDIFRFMKRLTENWGMRAFMVMEIPAQTFGELGDHTIITNWPSELLSIYDQEGCLRRSNVVRELQRTNLPFLVDLDFMVRGHEPAWQQTIIGHFKRFSFERGIWTPVQDAIGNRGALGMTGMHNDFNERDLATFFYIANAVYGRLNFVKNLDSRVVELLSDREIDCLNWTASGKTSAEIAEIMQLSEHTVNHYLNRATKKLDTVNRTQAVAKALRIGIIK